MCGRYSLTTPPQIVAQIFRVAMPAPNWPPRYNIAPTQYVPVIRARAAPGARAEPARQLDLMRWGFIPFWAEDPIKGGRPSGGGGRASGGGGMINAKSETAADKPAFRHAFRRQRCLVPADSFFEWKKLDERTKQPYLIRRRDHQPFAFAGLWDRWRGKEGESLESFTILTADPNELVRDIHDRMPVIIRPEDYDRWLDPRIEDPAQIKPLLAAGGPLPADQMEMHPVSRRVNKPEHDDPSCIEPAPAQPRAIAEQTPNLFDDAP